MRINLLAYYLFCVAQNITQRRQHYAFNTIFNIKRLPITQQTKKIYKCTKQLKFEKSKSG